MECHINYYYYDRIDLNKFVLYNDSYIKFNEKLSNYFLKIPNLIELKLNAKEWFKKSFLELALNKELSLKK